MAITLADFTKIWASTSPLTPYSFSDANYQEGWNFVGSTPPARQMWDSIQKNNDEKLKYIVDNFLPLSGGTMTGMVNMDSQAINFGTDYQDTARIYKISNLLRLVGGTNTSDGSYIDVGSPSASEHGIVLDAKDNSNETKLIAKPDGTLTWGGKAIIVGNQYTESFSSITVNANANKLVATLQKDPLYYSVKVGGTGYADISAIVNESNRNLYIHNTSSSNLTGISVTINYISLS